MSRDQIREKVQATRLWQWGSESVPKGWSVLGYLVLFSFFLLSLWKVEQISSEASRERDERADEALAIANQLATNSYNDCLRNIQVILSFKTMFYTTFNFVDELPGELDLTLLFQSLEQVQVPDASSCIQPEPTTPQGG